MLGRRKPRDGVYGSANDEAYKQYQKQYEGYEKQSKPSKPTSLQIQRKDRQMCRHAAFFSFLSRSAVHVVRNSGYHTVYEV